MLLENIAPYCILLISVVVLHILCLMPWLFLILPVFSHETVPLEDENLIVTCDY